MVRKNIKKIFSVMFILAIMLMLSPTNLSSAKTKVKLNKSKLTLTVGKKAQLKVTGTKKKVIWKSSNENVAMVSSKGKVVALKKGTAKITAKVQKKKYYCKVTVLKKNTAKTEVTSTPEPTIKPSPTPTPGVEESQTPPTIKPTATIAPTVEPTATPTIKPTATPTIEPTATPTIEPTVTPTIEPTVTPTDTPLDTYDKLTGYIKRNGEYDTDSNKKPYYYVYKLTTGESSIYDRLKYYPNDNKLVLSTFFMTTTGDTLLNLEIERKSIATGNMTFIITTDNNSTIVDFGQASVYVNKISKDTIIDFGCIYTSGNDLANTLLQYGLLKWDSMIKECGIENGLQALGFTSYK